MGKSNCRILAINVSRSYKKSPISKDYIGGAKRFANKKVRRTKGNIPNGKHYRRIYPQWDVHDYVSRWTLQDCIDRYYRWQQYSWGKDMSLEEEINNWHRWYYWK